MAGDMVLQLLGSHRTSIPIGELTKLKKIFKVSVASLMVRCAQLGILAKTSYGRLWAEIRDRSWNSPLSPSLTVSQPRFLSGWNGCACAR